MQYRVIGVAEKVVRFKKGLGKRILSELKIRDP